MIFYGTSEQSALRHQCNEHQRKQCLEIGGCELTGDRPGRPPTDGSIKDLKNCDGKFLVKVSKLAHPLPKHPSVRDAGGELRMKLSSVDPRSIITQEKVDGKLVEK